MSGARAHLLLIACAVVLCYANTLHAPFVLDDIPNIVENPAIRDLGTLFPTVDVAGIERHSGLNRSLLKTRYVGYLTLALNYRFHGLEVAGYHAVNIAVHLLNAFLVYWLAALTLRTPFAAGAAGAAAGRQEPGFRVPLFAALLFAVHPLQTQAVTYVVQRFASLATLFYLLALALYAAWRGCGDRPGTRRLPRPALYAASLLAAVLAMKTKEFAFTLPAAMVVYELLFFEGKVARRLLPLAPFLLTPLLIPLSLASAGSSFADVSGIREAGAGAAAGAAAGPETMAWSEYLFTQFRVLISYLRLLVLPVHQNIDHDRELLVSFAQPAVFLSFLFHAALVAAGVLLCRVSRRPAVRERGLLRLAGFGILFFYLAASAESGLVPILDLMFEHRMYLPSVGFFLAVAAAAEWLVRRRGREAPLVRGIVLSALAAAVLALAVATHLRNEVWGDAVRLWENAVAGSPGKARTRAMLGQAYVTRNRVADAVREFELSLRLKPDYVAVHYGLGYAYWRQGRTEEAIAHYRILLQHWPESAAVRNQLGMIYLNQGRLEEAGREFEIVLRLSPGGYPEARRFLEQTRGR
jgi:hypothetical protein